MKITRLFHAVGAVLIEIITVLIVCAVLSLTTNRPETGSRSQPAASRPAADDSAKQPAARRTNDRFAAFVGSWLK